MSKKETGFTLIELIVVIVILGILAAFALPRFADLDKEARRAVTEGLAGSIRASSALAHGKLLATGAETSITMEGQTIQMSNKYPRTSDIGLTIVDISGFTSSTVDGAKRFVPNGVSSANSTECMVEYTEPTAGNVPSIVVDVDNCT